ncbi:hypothetical protein [Pseudorhodobacter sp.]|uniref:hypothetical protein n=1 Tax=Paracoccaceae TaxID=31989 RepID=UPI002AFFB828|nr:hypothetical protein [Pseudorhodobacter sp.]
MASPLPLDQKHQVHLETCALPCAGGFQDQRACNRACYSGDNGKGGRDHDKQQQREAELDIACNLLAVAQVICKALSV